MTIFLFSRNIGVPAELRERCNVRWILSKDTGDIPDADLYIWEYAQNFETDIKWCIAGRSEAQHLIVTEEKYLEHFTELQKSICILLKPVAPFTLKAFVERAYETWKMHRHVREAEVLRHDRDTLLQYVLEVNLRLQKYDQERSNFLARALHDFRAPLTALHGYCGLLAEGKLGEISSVQRELLERMRYSTKRLSSLAGGTLDLLLQGRTEKPGERKEADLSEIVHRALDDVSAFVEDKKLQVNVDMKPVTGLLFMEPERIQQVLVNLLENSCKFTPKEGEIKVLGYPVQSAGDSKIGDEAESLGYRIDICDSGPGVPAALSEQIFEEFASYSGTGDRSGGGLGLAICRAIITTHNGRIWATPSAEGGRFSLVLPALPVEFGSASSAEEIQELETAECR